MSGRERERAGGRESGRKMETERERARAEEGESSRWRYRERKLGSER